MRIVLFAIVCFLWAANATAATDTAAVVNNTTVDLSPLVQVVVSFLGVVLPLIAAYVAWIIKQRMNIQQNSADAATIDAAVKRGAGLALDFLKKMVPANPTVDVRSVGIAQGANHVLAALPDTLARQGVTTDTVARMVSSELAQLEHAVPIPAASSTQAATPIPGEAVVVAPVQAPEPPSPAAPVSAPAPA